MQFQIDAPLRHGGVNVIPLIPDEPICRIEGYNGVGKTLAVRLLELCTRQENAYRREPGAWNSLCRLLGPTTITVSGVRPSSNEEPESTLQWRFDWRGLADEAVPDRIGEALFESVSLDGVDIALAEARRLLTIERIAGNDSVQESLAGLIVDDHVLVQAGRARAQGAATAVDRWLAEVTRSLDVDTALELRRTAALRDASRAALSNAESRSESLNTLRKSLLEAVDLEELLREVTQDADRLAKQVRTLEKDRSRAAELVAQRRASADAALRGLPEESKTAEAVRQAERLHQSRLSRLGTAAARAKELSAVVGLAPDRNSVEDAVAAAQTLELTLNERRVDLQSHLEVRQVVAQLRDVLARARTAGLTDRPVAIGSDGPMSVGQLLAAVDRRRVELEATSAEREAVAIEEQLRVSRHRGAALHSLLQAIERVERANELVVQSEDQLEDARTEAAATSEREKIYAQHVSALSEAERELLHITIAVDEIRRQLDALGGGRSREDLERDLARKLEELGLSLENLRAEVERVQRERVLVEDERTRRTTELSELEAIVESLETRLRESVDAFARDGGRALAGGDLVLPDPSETMTENARRIGELERRQEQARVMTQAPVSVLAQTDADLSRLLTHLRTGDEFPPDIDRLRRLYEPELRDLFAASEVTKALFDHGTLHRVNLAERQFEWQTPSGETRVRPFSAFSSGERAFAFTLAQLQRIDRRHAVNTMVAVDEFGALLSFERRRRLKAVIDDHLRSGSVSQVVLILPLAVDPDDLPTDDPRKQPLSDDRYFALPFDEVPA